MCLSTVDEKIAKPVALIQSGWKTFAGSFANPSFENFDFAGSRIVPVDKWIIAEGDKVKDGPSWGGYKAGFHIYEDETELRKMKNKRRVFFRNVLVRGRQDQLACVVAQEMYVPSKEDAWPPR